jgi:VWFA-related protein
MRIAPLFCIAALAVPSLHAQANNSADDGIVILRAETRLVLVDAVAVDKKNQFAADLTQKDFRLWEDGKEQHITSFSLESAGVSPERSNKHYIAMFFDTTTAGQTGQLAMRQEATHFVEAFASPDRYMAVVNFANNVQIVQNFTAETDRMKKALAVVQSTQVNNAGLVRDGAQTTATSTIAVNVDTTPYRNTLAALRSLAGSLAAIKGRKALVLFTGGAPLTSDLIDDLTSTIKACNKANVAVYTVAGNISGNADKVLFNGTNTRTTRADIAKINQPPQDQNLLNVLSEGTGGITFATTNDLAASLGKVALEQDHYYLLGYTPTIDSSEGTCHDLTVKVARSDLEVRARKGYCTSKPVDPLSGKPAGEALETRAASGATGNIAATMQLPWFYSQPNIASVELAMDIVPSAMKFQKEKGKLHGEIDLAGVAYKPDGSAGARFSDTVKLDFDNQKQAEEFLRTPYHYVNQFRIGPGQYNFRLAFSAENAFGKVELPLAVAPWNGKDLGASGLALSTDSHPVADLAAGLDSSLLEGQRQLIAKGNEIIPAGTNRFGKGEPAFVYFEAYEPLLTSATEPTPIGIRVRVLDKTGQAKSDTGIKTAGSFERPGSAVVPIVSPLPLAGLAPGAYKVEVTVMRQTGDPIVRTADFSVN